jgi:hypothetical protein
MLVQLAFLLRTNRAARKERSNRLLLSTLYLRVLIYTDLLWKSRPFIKSSEMVFSGVANRGKIRNGRAEKRQKMAKGPPM